MLRYALDNLGWYEFEGLVQSLLKTTLGLGVESWGGTGDWGRDAYCRVALRYPGHDLQDGPFVFQCKFVDGANAAGAKPRAALDKAISAELKRIASRHSVHGRGSTEVPAHYSLLTNASLSGTAKRRIEAKLQSALPGTAIHVHDGRDLCAWLDQSPETIRAFPLLWSLRDTGDMLRRWVTADVLARSSAALDEAKEIASVFVPTLAYSRALNALDAHHFVVLSGPPEVGKTSIGRILSLGMVARGWEALECRGPRDIERLYDETRCQVFVADDFFGRTEYDPRSVAEWQRELGHLLRLLDAKHWLILTTRAHLLNLAKESLDMTGKARHFPKPGEIVIDANDLSVVEKARILYRHAKHQNLAKPIRDALRRHATSIVKDPHFSPERIRRFVSEQLSLAAGEARAVLSETLQAAAHEALQQPTRQMSVSFSNLAVAQKWLLFAMLDVPRISLDRTESLRKAYDRLCPPEAQQRYDELVAQLRDAFVRIIGDSRRIDWVHPSCRDLAISELSHDARDRQHFMQHCSMEGIRLALSVGGGSEGHVRRPLLVTEQDWSLLVTRAAADTWMLFDVIRHATESQRISSLQGLAEDARIARLLYSDLWPEATRDPHIACWNVELLELYFENEVATRAENLTLDLDGLWSSVQDSATDAVEDTATMLCDRRRSLAHLARVAALVEKYAPPKPASFDQDIQQLIGAWAECVDGECSASYDETRWTVAERDEIGSDYAELAAALEELAATAAAQPWSETLSRAASHFHYECERLISEEPPYSDDERHERDQERIVDVDSLFVDL